MSDSPATPPDPVEAITAALARLRGRRRPPWAEGRGEVDGQPSEWRGPWGVRGSHAHGGPHGHGHPNGYGTGHAMPGGPGWPEAMQARFGGPARLRLLEALAAASDPLTVSEIGAAIGVDQPRASRLVQQSVDLGVVRREADPADARRTRIVLTDAGAALVRGFRGERRGTVEAALAAFTDQERADLARLLTKLADAWPRA
ncbi:MarR family winged helix-turn-helix transcriptional regulator [uncultured Microbacterium sp.]|uniref:MarR family winged helix-turn-helix transcriptional regulator n=1 Tax=uncultured Microbacterium sp. TaxID=191216 RepID=UPI0035CABE93